MVHALHCAANLDPRIDTKNERNIKILETTRKGFLRLPVKTVHVTVVPCVVPARAYYVSFD